MTIKDQVIQILTATGWRIDTQAKTKRYTVLTHDCTKDIICVGANGAFRIGKTVSMSISLATGKGAINRANQYALMAKRFDNVVRNTPTMNERVIGTQNGIDTSEGA